MTAAEWQARAAREVGNYSINAIFEIALALATSAGEWTISVNGSETDGVEYNAVAADWVTALEALDSVGEGGIAVTGQRKGPYRLEFIGPNAGTAIENVTADGTGLTPSQTLVVVPVQVGESSNLGADATSAWNEITDAGNDVIHFLRTKLALIDLCLGRFSGQVDQVSGQYNRLEAKDSQRFDHYLKMRGIVEGDLAVAESDYAASALGQSYGMKIAQTTPNGLPYGQLQRDSTTGRYQ